MIGKIVAVVFLVFGILGTIEMGRQAWIADRATNTSFGFALVIMFFALMFLCVIACSILWLIY